MIRHVLALLLSAATLGGCAVNQTTAVRYYQAGEAALARGNLLHAREMFSRAFINTQLDHMGPEAEAQVLAKLGRVYGNLCQYEDAEKAFMQSIDASAKAFGASSTNSFPERLELAQLSYDIGQYEKSVAYFDQAFPYGIAVIEKNDAPSYVAIIKDYSDALARTGRPDRATEGMAKVKLLEGKVATQTVGKGGEYVRYPTSCK